jgi:vancomycin permeability regulator SanA
LRRAIWTGGIVLIFLVAVHQYVVWSAADSIYSVADAPSRDVILVLGASVRPGGRPSPMLEERLHAAADLYHAGKGHKVIVSGDHGSKHYDEVHPMARALEARGVPARDIFLDHAGFRTLDSAHRARKVFGVDSMLVVTNPFHVARAVFLARNVGIDAAGVGADYGVHYSTGTHFRHAAREVLARILAFGDVFILGTGPRFLGPPIDWRGDGRLTRNAR